MTGADIAPLVAVLGVVVLTALAFAWLFARSDRGPADLLRSARDPSEDVPSESAESELSGLEPADDGATTTVATADGPAPSVPERDPPPLDAVDETVFCRHCGAENRTGYRYCRWCVRSGFVDDGSGGTADAAMPNRSL